MMEKTAIVIAVISILGIVGIAAYDAYWQSNHTCVKGHNYTYWYQPAPIYMKSGDMLMPIQQPGYEKTEYVCDEYRK